MTVEVDKNSGFCAGVIRAIEKAEDYLDHIEDGQEKRLYSLGAIVHNESELSRLGQKGLVTVDKEDLEEMQDASGESLLIRAHGEPPATYSKAESLGFKIIDCTCPVVLKLQQDIRQAYGRMHDGPRKGQIIIFGKIGHPEVMGLLGQVGGDAIVIEDMKMLSDLIADGTICLHNPVKGRRLLVVHNTICSQVATRHAKLSRFALDHDIIIFVSGKASSNGKVLCDLCKSLNIRTYHISSESELKKEWFRREDNVGVCGATSTPKWLLEQIAAAIRRFY